MTFGEKIKELRKERGMSQTELSRAAGVSLRTVRGWELEGRYPRYRDLYAKLAEILHCDTDYLLTEEEGFVTAASEQYGLRGEKQARSILQQTAAMFAGGELSDEDQLAFLTEIQTLYLDSKKRAKRFAPGSGNTGKTETASQKAESTETIPADSVHSDSGRSGSNV